jgi:3-methylfumaryl-CoA hydratase
MHIDLHIRILMRIGNAMNTHQAPSHDDQSQPVARQQAYTADTARRVAAMLGRSGLEWSSDDDVPFGWHFPLLGAETRRNRLRSDGFPGLGIAMPDLPGKRLVAAGRTVDAPGVLRIDQAIERTSRIKSITPKATAQGAITIVVVHHLLCDLQTQERLIEEEQTFILLDTPYTPTPPTIDPITEPIISTATPDDTLLFQFSALSFNSHKIHLDRDYARTVEGYPDLVINGGLTTLFMTEIARVDAGVRIKRLKVRNLAPLFVNRPIQFVTAQKGTMHFIRAHDECGRFAAEMEYETDVL